PAVTGAANLTVNIGSGNVITMPFSRSLSPAGANGILTMAAGDIDLGSNSLTLGTSSAFPGTLSYTSPSRIRVTTGSFERWYPVSGLPVVAGGTSIGWYPLAGGVDQRDLSVYFSSSTALSAGGTI